MKEIKFVDILGASESLKENVRLWRNKEFIRKSMLTQHIITEEEHFKWIENLKKRKHCKNWIIFIGGKPIGSIYLHNINYEKSSSEWGFYIGEDQYRRKGLAGNILFEFLEMFFEKMSFKTLITIVLSNNAAALNIYNKFKFKEINRAPFNSKSQAITLKFSKEDWLKSKPDIAEGIRKETYYLCEYLRPLYLLVVYFRIFAYTSKNGVIYYLKPNKLSRFIEKNNRLISKVFADRITIKYLPNDFSKGNAYLTDIASRKECVDALYDFACKIDKELLQPKSSLFHHLSHKLSVVKDNLRLYIKHEVILNTLNNLFLVELAARFRNNPQNGLYKTDLILFIDKRNYWVKLIFEYADQKEISLFSINKFEIKTNKAFQFLFYTLKLFIEYAGSLFIPKRHQPQKKINRIGIPYYVFENFTEFHDKRNYYLFWYPDTGIDPQRILIYSDGCMNISPEEKKKIEDSGFTILSCNSFLKKGVNVAARYKCSFKVIKSFFNYLWHLIKLLFHIRTRPAFEQWKILAVLFIKLAYWEEFFSSNNIKIKFRFQDIFSHRDIAACLAGAVTMTYNYSNHSVRRFNILHQDICDIYFIGGRKHLKCILNEHSAVKVVIHTGYIFDYTFEALGQKAQQLRRSFIDKSKNFVISILDENIICCPESLINLYRSLLEFSLNEPDVGLIIKPKRSYTRNVLETHEKTSEFFHLLEKRGGVKLLDSSRYPVEAGKASDLVIGVYADSTAALECSLAGTPAIIYECFTVTEEQKSNSYLKYGKDKVVFYNIKTMLDSIKSYKLSRDRSNGFADWSNFLDETDSFRDGKASRRIGLYIKTLLYKFDEGLTKNIAVKESNRVYADHFGNDKVVSLI